MAHIHILALDATRQGGAGVYTTRFAKELAERGHTVTLICHESNNELKNILTVHEIPRAASSRPFGLWRLASLLQLGTYYQELKKLQLPKAEIVLGSAQPMVWAYYKLFPKRPLIYLPHSLVAPIELESYGYENKIQRKIAVGTYHYLEKWCLQKAMYTVRFTNTACDAFIKHYGDAVRDKLIVIPMPIEIPCSSHSDQKSNIFRILSVGRLIKSKNLMFLLEILSQMLDLKWNLDLIGSGDEQKSLEKFAISCGMQDRLIFHGHVEDVKLFYRRSDLFVFPSVLENLGIVLLEAMSYSLPTLSFKPDGLNFKTATDEIIVDQKNGLLASDKQEFKILLRRAIEGKVDLNSIGLAAALSVNEKHRWDQHLNQLEVLIEKMKRVDHEN